MINPCDEYPNYIGRDREHGAYVRKSRAQYTLVVEYGSIDVTKHYSRRRVKSDEQALQEANATLAKLLESEALA